MMLKTILLQLVWCWASKMPRLTGLDRNKPEIWEKRYLKRAIELGFNKSFAHIFQFPVPRARFPLLVLVGTFRSEDATAAKTSLQKWTCVPHRDYSNSLTLSNAGKPSRSWISKNCIQVWRENKISSSLVYVLPEKYNQSISRDSRAKTAKKCTKK